MADLVYLVVFTAVDCFIAGTFLAEYMGTKYTTGIRKYLGFIIFFIPLALFSILFHLKQDESSLVTYNFLYAFIFMLSCYLFCPLYLKVHPLKKLLTICIVFLIFAFLNIPLSLILEKIADTLAIDKDSFNFDILAPLFNKFGLFYVSRFILNRIRKDDIFLDAKNWMLIIMSPLLTIMVIFILFPIFNSDDSIGASISFFIVTFSLFVSNVVTYYLYFNTITNSRSVLQLQQMKQQQEYEKRYYDELTKKHDEIRIIRHNIKNQLIYLQAAIHEDRKDEAVDFIGKITQNVESTGDYVRTNNYAVNCILNAMFVKAKAANIRTNAQVIECIDTVLDPTDMTVILGNLMENAIEACLKLNEDEREIRVTIERDLLGLLIQIANRTDTQVLNDNPGLVTDKPDKDVHGLGVRSVRKLIQKYDGTMVCYEEDGYFIWTIVFKEDAD